MSTVPLGEVATFIRGVTFKPGDILEGPTESSVGVMRTKNVQTELDTSDTLQIPRSLVRRAEQYLRYGDVLISSANSWNLVGRCSWVPELAAPTAIGGFVTALRSASDRLEPKYLYRWFSSPRIQAEVRNTANQTTNIANLNLKRCEALQIPLPPLDVQRHVAAVFDRVDSIRTTHRRLAAAVRETEQAAFMDTFADSETKELGDQLSFVTSGGRGWAKYYADEGSPFVRSLDVKMGNVSSEELAYVAAPRNAEARRTRTERGDVLLTITGSRIGRASVLPTVLEGAYVSQHVAILRPDPQQITPDYLAAFLCAQNFGQAQIRAAQYGQTKPGLNFEQIRRFRIPIADLTQQREFCAKSAATKKLAAKAIEAQAMFEVLAASVGARAFSGQL